MIGALNIVTNHFTGSTVPLAGKRAAPVDTGIAQAMSRAVPIAKQGKITAEHFNFHGPIAQFLAQAGWIPEIDKH